MHSLFILPKPNGTRTGKRTYRIKDVRACSVHAAATRTRENSRNHGYPRCLTSCTPNTKVSLKTGIRDIEMGINPERKFFSELIYVSLSKLCFFLLKFMQIKLIVIDFKRVELMDKYRR